MVPLVVILEQLFALFLLSMALGSSGVLAQSEAKDSNSVIWIVLGVAFLAAVAGLAMWFLCKWLVGKSKSSKPRAAMQISTEGRHNKTTSSSNRKAAFRLSSGKSLLSSGGPTDSSQVTGGSSGASDGTVPGSVPVNDLQVKRARTQRQPSPVDKPVQTPLPVNLETDVYGPNGEVAAIRKLNIDALIGSSTKSRDIADQEDHQESLIGLLGAKRSLAGKQTYDDEDNLFGQKVLTVPKIGQRTI